MNHYVGNIMQETNPGATENRIFLPEIPNFPTARDFNLPARECRPH